MRVGQLSDKGTMRSNNEDSVYSSKNNNLFIIADGMGGHNAGDIASKAAIDKVKYFIRSRAKKYDLNSDSILELICNSLEYANRYIFALASKNPKLKGMGTTIIAAYVYENAMYISHVGDSRAYIISNDSIKQVTNDHSLAAELYRKGTITREEAVNYPHKNIITRALGCSSVLEIDTHILHINKGDIILLCTDGLTNMLTDSQLLSIVNSNDNPRQAAKTLVNEANKAGGSDNISVIIIKNDD